MVLCITKSKLARFFLSFLLVAAYVLFLIHFYYTYVPLIPFFQSALAPCLFITLILTLAKIEWGLLAFIFLFPLINFLPYIFNIYEEIPHAPTSLVLFLFFLLGWAIRKLFYRAKGLLTAHPLHPFLTLYLILILISGLITFLRYGNFSPFLTQSLPELVVNIDGVRAGGARMSTLFSSLNLASGLFFSAILWSYLKEREFRRKALIALSISFLISLIFGLFQLVALSPWARLPRWVFLQQIQSTYKDPNSFAFFLAAFSPFLVAAFMAKKKWRLPAALFLGLVFLCLQASGTRSAFLSSLVGIIFCLIASMRTLNLTARKKLILSLSASIILLAFFLNLYLFSSMTLSKRLFESLADLRKGLINDLFSNKTILWKTALAMFSDYPLTGVGVGSYIVELPNYLREKNLSHVPVDSAENVIFQVMAELGLAGLIFISLLLIKYFKEAKKRWSLITNQWEKILAVGLAGSLLACVVNFLFHSYIGSFEAKFLFWFLATFFLAVQRESISNEPAEIVEEDCRDRKNSRLIKAIGTIILILFTGLHLFNSLQSLSIPERSAKFGWPQDFGFYGWEKDWRGSNFRWAKKEAGISVPTLGPEMSLWLHASHPDIEKNPVRIEIYLADRWFKKRMKIYSLEMKDKAWHQIIIPLWKRLAVKGSQKLVNSGYANRLRENNVTLNTVGEPPIINLIFEASRSWSPKRVLGIPDSRDLAFALGEIWFRYPPLASAENYEVINNIPSSQWIGSQGAILAGNGSAEIFFSVEEENCLLRLHARGEKALNLGPIMNIYLDGKLVAKTSLETEAEELLYFHLPLLTGQHSLRVEFINDFYSPSLGQDRNLFLGNVEILRLNILH